MVSYILLGAVIGGLLAWGFLSLVYDVLVRRNHYKTCLYYRQLYNEQVGELQVRYRQERVAMIHRYEGRIADIQKELEQISYCVDPEKTKKIGVG